MSRGEHNVALSPMKIERTKTQRAIKDGRYLVYLPSHLRANARAELMGYGAGKLVIVSSAERAR